MEATVFLFVNGRKIYQFKAKYSETKKTLCLGDISGDVSANKMKKPGLNVEIYDFSVDYKTFDTVNTIGIYKY